MLLLGGFAIAAALSKHALAKRGATWILARVGGRPATVLLTNMLVGAPAKASRVLLVASGVGDTKRQVERPGRQCTSGSKLQTSALALAARAQSGLHQSMSRSTLFL